MIIEATIAIEPGDLGVNHARRAHVRGGTPGTHRTPPYTRALDTFALALRLVREGRCFAAGPLFVTLAIYRSQKLRIGPAAQLPKGDIDGPIKGILDACTLSGVWTDDSQVVRLVVTNGYDRLHPRIEIRIEEERET